MMTWNSLLLSKGSIFTVTQRRGTNATAPIRSAITPTRNARRSHFNARSPAVVGKAEMAHDVFDDDNGVIDKDADREDQREQRDVVEGIAVEEEEQQRERQRHRNGDEHHAALAPAESERDQERDREDCDRHVKEELIVLCRGGLAVVARDGDPH